MGGDGGGMNEVQDLLNELHACANLALEALQKNDLDECGRMLKVIIGELAENLDGDDE
jgi:hypothetical protein